MEQAFGNESRWLVLEPSDSEDEVSIENEDSSDTDVDESIVLSIQEKKSTKIKTPPLSPSDDETKSQKKSYEKEGLSPPKRKMENLLEDFLNSSVQSLEDDEMNTSTEKSLDSEEEEVIEKLRESQDLDQYALKKKGLESNCPNPLLFLRKMETEFRLPTNTSNDD
jgi:hypothetical protein